MVPTDDEILAAEYMRFMAVAAKSAMTVSVWNAENPRNPRDAHGRFADTGADFPLPAPQAGFIQDAADAPDRMTLRPGLASLRSKAKVEQALRAGLSAKFGHDVQVDLGRKMHLQTMKELSEGLLRGAEDWPKARLHKVSAASRLPGPAPDAWAVTMDRSDGVEIMFNERQFGNRSRFLAKLKRTVDSGSARPSQDNAAYVAVHEFGHVVDRHTVPKDRQILPAVWAHLDDVGIDPDDDAAINKYIRDQLGDYAMKSPSEMIAEAFADVQLNGFFDAAPLSRVIVTRLRKYHDDMPGSSQAVGAGRAPAPVVDVPAPVPAAVPAVPAAAEIPKDIPRHRWGAYHGDLAGLEDIAGAVENGKMLKDKSLAGGICGDTRLREYEGGMKVVYKRDTGYIGAGPKHAADAEQLASKLALAMGIRAPRIYRNSEDEVHMEYMGDAKVAVEARRKMRLTPIVESPKGRLVGLLDLMLQNADRHEKNWMVGPNKEPVVIDHGLSWAAPHMTADDAAIHIASPFAAPYKAVDQPWRRGLRGGNDLTKAEVAELRRRISALRPEFDRLGRGNWLDFSLSMLDAIGAGARGTVPQLGLDT